MKFKDIGKIISMLLIVLFLILYIGTSAGYYQKKETRKQILTEDAIKRFEEDVKNGKKIIASNYLEKEKNYNNKISIICMKISNTIVKLFDKILKTIFKKLENVVNN